MYRLNKLCIMKQDNIVIMEKKPSYDYFVVTISQTMLITFSCLKANNLIVFLIIFHFKPSANHITLLLATVLHNDSSINGCDWLVPLPFTA